MSSSARLLVFFAAFFATMPMFAQIVETFDSSANWSSYYTLNGAALAIQNGRLEYVTTSASTAGVQDEAHVKPTPGAIFGSDTQSALVGRLDTSWSAQVNVHVRDFSGLNSGAPATPRDWSTSEGFGAMLKTISLKNTLGDHGEGVQIGYWPDSGTFVHGSIYSWGISGYAQADATGVQDFILRSEYDAEIGQLAGKISFDAGASWIVTSSLALSGSAWGYGSDFSGPAFGITLGAFSNNIVVNSGDIYFDNFTYEGLSLGDWPVTGSAIPEPSTYAGLAGFAALGLVIWKRRKISR